MTETPDIKREPEEAGGPASMVTATDAWFVREVLPLEADLLKFMRRGWRNESDVRDLCQDVYVEVYEAARKEIPASARAFAFAMARNILIDRIRREQIVSIEAVADPEILGIAVDEPGPDRTAIARQDLRRLQAALDRLPELWRKAVVMRKVEGLAPSEIAMRLGIAERTAFLHLASGLAMLTDLFQDELPNSGNKP
jgi:RNA polymerase sigma factor (sigma-70 family)